MPAPEILTWREGKRAAYTLEFDDRRPSHFRLAAPEMARRGIVGTFNINTGGIRNWKHWKKLSLMGNEISSHTVSHEDLTGLGYFELEYELGQSQKDIEENIGIRPVSVAMPFGSSGKFVEIVAARFYLSARNGWGINASSLSGNEYYRIRGIGVYPPFSRQALQEKLHSVIRSRGYLVVYFHSLAMGDSLLNATYAPFSLFQQHLNDVQALSDSLWIAPRGEVIRYMRLRQDARVVVKVSGKSIRLWLESELSLETFSVPLSIRFNWPRNWLGYTVLKKSNFSDKWSNIRLKGSDGILSCHLGEIITLVAVE